MEKLSGYEFWRQKLKSAKYIVAPMVDQSELPWRLLSRKYSAELCYTPMFHAALFVKDAHYRKESMVTCEEDRPLIVQFCANDPEILLQAAKLVEPYCDGIDINLGCPQSIAKKGHYGAFLQDEWELIKKMVNLCHKELSVPITCKIRRFSCVKKTIEYAQMLEKAGCQILTVHGRTREQKGPLTGLADWSYIKAVKENVNIPVFANGNIQYLSDVENCMKETNADGVMTAEGNLHNPALFNGINPLIWDMSIEYLDIAEKYPCALSAIRGHIFKICHHALQIHTEVRNEIANAKNIEEFRAMVDKLKMACQSDVDKYNSNPEDWTSNLPLPYWRCQPYVRPDPHADLDPEKKVERDKLTKKRAAERNIVGLENMSRKKLKRMLKNPNKDFLNPTRQVYVMCTNSLINCLNPRNLKCVYEYCKPCCMKKTREETLDCAGHNFMVKTRRERNKELNRKQLNDKLNQTCDNKTQGNNSGTRDGNNSTRDGDNNTRDGDNSIRDGDNSTTDSDNSTTDSDKRTCMVDNSKIDIDKRTLNSDHDIVENSTDKSEDRNQHKSSTVQ